jgi:poly-gamma-glutamate synthesis protein (capsule biosynthesis protein)
VTPISLYKGLAAAAIIILSSINCICTGQSETRKKLSLLFIGDIMGHKEQIWAAENKESRSYNYDSVFTYIRYAISEADIAIANLEVTLAGSPYNGYPVFSSPAALATACKNAGIGIMVTANNHAADRGAKGIAETIRRLDSIAIQHTGTFISSAERERLYPFMLMKNGISLALLNYTYGTNVDIAEDSAIVNIIDKDIIDEDIKKARSRNPDIIIVFMHWGIEYVSAPAKSQYDIAGHLFSAGADIVIGSHPHVLQKMVWLKSAPPGKGRVAVYSLGNFVSNQRRRGTDGGAMARIEITKEDTSCYISDAGYYLTWVYSPGEKQSKRFFVLPCSEYENKQSFFSEPSQHIRMKQFINESRSVLYKQNINFYEIIFNGSSWLLNF